MRNINSSVLSQRFLHILVNKPLDKMLWGTMKRLHGTGPNVRGVTPEHELRCVSDVEVLAS